MNSLRMLSQTSRPRKNRRKSNAIRVLLVLGLLMIFAIVAGPAIVRYGYVLYKSGFSFSQASQYHNLKNFGVPVPMRYKVHGIDVSHHQGDINWSEVAAMDVNGIRVNYAFIKATEGITRQDRQFKRNWEKSHEAGIVRGAYHFFHPSRDATKQANNFIEHVALEPGDLPPVIDVEVSNHKSKAEIVAGVKEWCRLVEDHYKIKPVIYTNPGFFMKYLATDFDDYPLWIANYHKESPSITHRKWHFWQHTDNARVNGVRGGVDLNVFNGNMNRLKLLCIKEL